MAATKSRPKVLRPPPPPKEEEEEDEEHNVDRLRSITFNQ